MAPFTHILSGATAESGPTQNFPAAANQCYNGETIWYRDDPTVDAGWTQFTGTVYTVGNDGK
jgi:hypothetical protein